MYDFSVDAPPDLPDQLKFHKEGIGPVKTGNCDNYLAHLKANHDEHRKVLLKIDVEGAEYDWLLQTDIAEVSRTAICIAFEFHWLDTKGDAFIRCVEKLKAHYHIVHLHGNNAGGMVGWVPRVPELTFVHKAAATFGGPVKIKYPITGLEPCQLPAHVRPDHRLPGMVCPGSQPGGSPGIPPAQKNGPADHRPPMTSVSG